MSKKYRSKNDPWTYFSKQSDSIFTEQFINDKILTFKTTHQTSNGIVKFKQLVSKEKGKKFNFEEQLKLWLPTWGDGSSLFLNFKKNYAKFQYEHGLRQYSGKLINFYGGARCQKDFTNIVFKLGANWLGVNTSFDSRLRIAMLSNQQTQISSGHKINWSLQKWMLDLFAIFNYHSLSIFSNSFRVIYKINNDQSLFFKGTNQKLRKISHLDFTNPDTYFTGFTVDYTHNLDQLTKAGVQTEFTKNGLANTSVVLWRKLEQHNSRIKGKISTNKSVSLSYISTIKDYGKWILGLQISDLGGKNDTKFGLLIDISV